MNTVHLTGTVEYVSIKDFTKWIAASVKIKCDDGTETWVDVKGVEPDSPTIETIRELKGKYVFIEGYLNSREAPAKEDKPARTVYSVATNTKRIKTLDGPLGFGPNNSVVLVGRVEETKTSSAGDLFAKLSISYWKPRASEYGKRFVRVKCPANTILEERGSVLAVGSITDLNGVIVNATAIHAY